VGEGNSERTVLFGPTTQLKAKRQEKEKKKKKPIGGSGVGEREGEIGETKPETLVPPT